MNPARSYALPLAAALSAVLLAGACGYRFVDPGAGLPEDVATVHVEPFQNRTRSPGLEQGLALALRRELGRVGRPRLVERSEDADAVLSGVVRHYGVRAVSVNRFDEALQMEVRLEVEATLRRRPSGEVLWPRRLIRLREVYAAARGAAAPGSSGFLRNAMDVEDVGRLTDAGFAEDSRRATRKRLLESFARSIRERMAEGL